MLIKDLEETNKENTFNCLKLLLAKGCSPNMPDYQSKTPFFDLLTLENEQKKFGDIVDFFLEECVIDFLTYRGQETLELLKEVKPAHEIIETPKVINYEFMMKALSRREELDFEIYFKAFQAATSSEDFTDNCSSFLEDSAFRGMRQTVDFLVENSADINARPKYPKYLNPPAFLACSSGYFRVLETLLKKPEIKLDYQKGKLKHTLLHEICQTFTSNCKATVNVDYRKCFDLILKHPKCDLNAEDNFGCSALHFAVMHKNDYATIALLKKGAFINEQSVSGKAPIDEIPASIMESFLDECITKKEREDKGEDIEIDYSFLISPKRNWDVNNADKRGFCREVATLQRIAQNEELKNLVSHPVLSSFLLLKWARLGFCFYINLFICSMFMVVLISSVVLSEVKGYRKENPVFFSILMVLSWINVIALISREFFQLAFNYKQYLRNLSNWFEILLISLCCMFGFTIATTGVDHESDENQKAIKAFLIVGVCFEFLQIIGSLPIFSISTHMVILKRVSITFLKSLMFYSIIIIAFGFAFFVMLGDKDYLASSDTKGNHDNWGKDLCNFTDYALKNLSSNSNTTNVTNTNFNMTECIIQGNEIRGKKSRYMIEIENTTRYSADVNQQLKNLSITDLGSKKADLTAFRYPMISVLKAFMMLIGEIDAGSLKLDSFWGNILLFLFMFLVTIVLFNLLNALAISDTQVIKAKGEIIDLIDRIEVLHGYESVIFKKLSGTIFIKLQSIISLYPYVLPERKIIISPDKGNETIALNTQANLRSRFSIFKNLGSKVDCESEELAIALPRMSNGIMKKIKQTLANKEDKITQEANENKLKEDISDIKTQMDIQMTRHNEVFDEHKERMSEQMQVLDELKRQMDKMNEMLLKLTSKN